MRRGRRKPPKAEISSPCTGVATYYTEQGDWVFHAAIEADPMKGPDWVRMVASAYPGGEFSVEFLQEFRADDEARAGERLYWAFAAERNVVPWFRVPPEWPIYLGADFGQRNPTAIMFLAQDPASKKLFVFDSIYQPRGIDVDVKEQIYQKIAKHTGVSMETLVRDGLHRHIERAVADPTANAYVEFYRLDPFPVLFIIKVGSKIPSRHRPGESRVNGALWPAGVHCGLRFFPPVREDPPETIPCPMCAKEIAVEPALFILDGAAPQLVEEYETIIDEPQKFEALETPEKAVKTPDHASDALRYVLFDMLWDPDEVPDKDDEERVRVKKLRELAPHERGFEEKLQLMMANLAEQKRREDEMLSGRRSHGLTFSRRGRGFGAITYSSPFRSPKEAPKA